MRKVQIVVSLPVVKCCECGMVLTFSEWCLHSSGVYCLGCAPSGSLVFA